MAQLTDYTDLVTSEHSDKPRFMATLSAVAQCFVDLQNGLIDIPDEFDLDNAVGVQLDAVGLWVGISRKVNTPLAGVYFSFDTSGLGFDQGVWQGPFDPTTGVTSLDDDTYRLLLRAKIGANHWDGTLGTSAAILNAIFGGSASSSTPVTITATNEPFGTGNGATTQFQLSYQGTPLFTYTDATIYRNDWQGNQKLVTTPRTNNSISINNFSQYLGTTITPNSGTAPDGSNTAALIAYQSGAGGNLYQLLNNAVGLQTYSIYAKAGSVGAQFTIGNDKLSTPALVTFNLFTGVVVSSSGGATGSILSMGNGWYRCSVTFTEPSGMAGDSFVTLPLDRPGTIFQWGAQAEQGSIATPYITTTSAAATVTDYSISSAALVTSAVPPVTGAVLSWTGHSTAYPTGTYVFIVDNGDMTIDYGIAGTLPSAVFLALLRGGYIPLKPEAVHINGYFAPSVTNTPLFGFDVANNLISGFDVGSWAASA